MPHRDQFFCFLNHLFLGIPSIDIPNPLKDEHRITFIAAHINATKAAIEYVISSSYAYFEMVLSNVSFPSSIHFALCLL